LRYVKLISRRAGCLACADLFVFEPQMPDSFPLFVERMFINGYNKSSVYKPGKKGVKRVLV